MNKKCGSEWIVRKIKIKKATVKMALLISNKNPANAGLIYFFFLATGFLTATFFTAGFLATGFLTATFFTAGFLATGFLTATFFTAGFLATGFFAAGFLAATFFTAGLAATGFFAVFLNNTILPLLP